MEVPNPLKMERLTITKIEPNNNTPVDIQRFEAMFNPSQYSVRYHNVIRSKQYLRPGEHSTDFVSQEPRLFSIQLVFDGTGVTESGFTTGMGLVLRTVKERIKRLLEICYKVQEHPHAPSEIQVQWGMINFKGLLQSLNINYTLFDQSGDPLRANVDMEIVVGDDSEVTPLSSPDLTHTRTVKAGDSLPLLARAIYGSSRYYLLIAEANGLDDFRNLKPGTVLHFPPLTNSLNA